MSTRSAREFAENVRSAVAEDRRVDAIRLFFADSGMPQGIIDAMAADPGMQSLVPSMHNDLEVMGNHDGGTIPEPLVRAVHVPALVLAGGASAEFFRDTAARVTRLLPDGRSAVLEGHDHAAPPEVVAPVVTQFLTAQP